MIGTINIMACFMVLPYRLILSPSLGHVLEETATFSAVPSSADMALPDRQAWHVHPVIQMESSDEALHKIGAEGTMHPFPFELHIMIKIIMNQHVVPWRMILQHHALSH